MKKSHRAYLRKIIGSVMVGSKSGSQTMEADGIKTPSTPIYQLMRDIVCDARFYSVIDDADFWKTYGSYRIGRFIDSISESEWNEEEALTMSKEDFLNEWMGSHMLPISPDRRKEIEADIRILMLREDGKGVPDPEEHDGSSLGVINLGKGIKDSTERAGEPTEDLPPNLRDYMEDATGGSSPGMHNDGHKADARFLDRTDQSIVSLAGKIGRRGGRAAAKGKFRPAPKSDISGVTVGDDLNSLLPSELALLASPQAEDLFFDRFVRKRLQTFSSISVSSGRGKSSGGPIYVCIDTSGSMVGQPEQLAKTLALAISIIAQEDKRPVIIFNYSDALSFFLLNDLDRQRKKLLRFLSDSYGGGNDENKLFRFVFDRMPKTMRYKEYASDFKGADMLVISDFCWDRIEKDTACLIESARRKGMRIFSVGIDAEQEIGNQFFAKSDFRYVYEDGVIKDLMQ